MSDLKLTWNEWGADAAVEGHDLALEDGLATAVILSRFIDARARPADTLPGSRTDRRGFWADTVTGRGQGSGSFRGKRRFRKSCAARTTTPPKRSGGLSTTASQAASTSRRPCRASACFPLP